LNNIIEKKLNKENISICELKKHPEIYNKLLDSVCQTLTIALLNTKSSGVFIILDCTVNPNLSYSDSSRSGLYICNIEPNVNILETPNLHMLRGPVDIAKNNDIIIHPKWKLEFDINKDTFFTKIMETVRNNAEQPLSKLYHWHTDNSLYNNDEEVIICSVPLIATDGTIYGVCGFEVSQLLFKLSYIPDIPFTDTAFSMLSKVENNAFNLKSSFISANYPVQITKELSDNMLSCRKKSKSLFNYFCTSGQFIGMHKNISLYAEDSPYNDKEWAVSIMIPADDYERAVGNINRKVVFCLLALLLISIAASFWITKFFTKPITETINKMKQIKPSEIEKTNIVEIDDLLEFLSRQDRHNESETKTNNTPITDIKNTNMFNEFLKNIQTLSPAERAVFDLYMEGYTAKEIAEKLYLSINTIKTHNKRIYEKMNVSSRNELMVYFKMMKEINSNKQEN